MFFIIDEKPRKMPPDPEGGGSGPGMPDDNVDISREAVAELVRSAQAGDDDAFSSLVYIYEKFVFNSACRVLSSQGLGISDAEDIAQNSFIKAWRSLGRFRGDCTFSTWLFRITVNTAKDYIRSEKRRPRVSITRNSDDSDETEEWDLPVSSGDEVPEDALDRKESVIMVRKAIEALPKEQRDVIVLRDLDGLSYQEIADKLSIEIGTVRSRISRGRDKIKNTLLEWNFL
ncbi:MAG: sigma-70 family RNA polymerase sigma factor [Clostridia bacterium]|nr:sigma-70 family RNA polymerase sigma factor [Clostridia bacterium]